MLWAQVYAVGPVSEGKEGVHDILSDLRSSFATNEGSLIT